MAAGLSNSDDGQNPLRLANLVVIDTQTAQVVQTINLAWPLNFTGQFDNGGPYDVIPQSLPSMVAFVPARNGTLTGAVYVALSNGAGTSAGIQAYYSGTVQSWRANFALPQPLSIDATGKAPTAITRTHVSNYYNPLGLTRYTNPDGFSYLILTDAGASIFDANFVAHPATNAFLEFLDLDTEQWRDAWAVDLGPILPATQAITLGTDAHGTRFGLMSSQTFAAAYVLRAESLSLHRHSYGRGRPPLRSSTTDDQVRSRRSHRATAPAPRFQ